MLTQVTFVRHGENKPYAEGQPKYPGPGLTKKGFSQAKRTASYLKDYKFDRIYCSDMTRAMDTANEIKKYQRAKLTCHHEFSEASIIIYDKKPKDKKKYVLAIERVNTAIKFFKKILKQNKGKNILIVAHGNIIRSIIADSLGMPFQSAPSFHMINCSVSTLVFEKEKLVCMPQLCFAAHHHRKGFKEEMENFHERRAYFMNLRNRIM